jgi:hypothetical protein
MVKRFASHNDNVVFGDVSLSDGGPRIGQPGAGGWPTLRIFTKETGEEGEAYVKKTNQAMCDELKQEEYMQGIIEEKSGVVHETRPAAAPAATATPPRGSPTKAKKTKEL